MDIEDLVYKSGIDGKPKPKRNKPLNSYVTRTGQSVTAHSFAAAVKADLDAKELIRQDTAGVKDDGRFAARRGDTKGHSKNIYKGSARMGETLIVNSDTVVESAITQEHLKDFFKGQPLHGGSDFALQPPQPPQAPAQGSYRGGTLDGSADTDAFNTDSQSAEELHMQQQAPPSRNAQRRQSSNQLEYLYRASTLQSATRAKGTSSPSKHTQKVLQSRRRKTKREPHEEQDWRDAMSDSLIRMYEIQARIEAEKAQGSSLLTKMGQMFTWRSDTASAQLAGGANATKPTASEAPNALTPTPTPTPAAASPPRPATTSNPYVKKAKGRKAKSRLNKETVEAVEEDANVDVNSPEHVRSFTSMFRLPSLFSAKR